MNTFSSVSYIDNRNRQRFQMYMGIEGCGVMKRKTANKGIVSIAFALGLLISCFASPRFLIATLAITVILLGICCAKYH